MFPKPPWEAFPFPVCCSCQYSWRRISGSPVCPSSEGSGCVVAPFVSHLWLSLPLGKDFTKPVPTRGFSPKIQIPDPSWSQGPFLGVSPEAVAPRAPVPGWAPLGQGRDRPPQPHAPGQAPGNAGSPGDLPTPNSTPQRKRPHFHEEVLVFFTMSGKTLEGSGSSQSDQDLTATTESFQNHFTGFFPKLSMNWMKYWIFPELQPCFGHPQVFQCIWNSGW